MKRWIPSLALMAIALSSAGAGRAATTPEGTLKQFMTAMLKKDRKSIQTLIDWQRMGKTMNMGGSTPEQRERMMRYMKTIYTEGFALGAKAKEFRLGPVSSKGAEAKGVFLKQDTASKKWVPTTQFQLHKKGKEWQIYSITGVKR
jgi:hypothetical protein